MAAMAAVTLALIGFFAFFMIQMTSPQMVPLFTDLSTEDPSAIVKDLERQAIPYEIKNDGAIVMAPKDKVARLRMKLAEGEPAQGRRRRHCRLAQSGTLAEHVCARIQRQICAQHTGHGGYLPLIALSAKWGQAFAESMVGTGEDRQLAMQPSKLSEFITLVRERFETAAREGDAPVLVTSAGIRPYVRGIVERFRAQTPVVSQSEIHPRARLKTVGSI